MNLDKALPPFLRLDGGQLHGQSQRSEGVYEFSIGRTVRHGYDRRGRGLLVDSGFGHSRSLLEFVGTRWSAAITQHPDPT